MLTTLPIERVADVRSGVGESPFWHVAEQAWYWVAITEKKIWRYCPTAPSSQASLQYWNTNEMLGCLTQAADGSFIAGMESGVFQLHLSEAHQVQAKRLAAPAELGQGMRFNDGRCDRQGRFWSGTMFMDMAQAKAIGHLYRYSAQQGISTPFVSGLFVQNGLAWSPDGRTMYLSDSHPNSKMIWAFDYDCEVGVPHNQRVFVNMKALESRPDGAAVDIDGCYWICGNDGSRLLRFTPEGKLDKEIALPMKKPAMCSFGGPNLDTLMVTSIGVGQPEDDEWAGATILLRPGTQGIAETAFVVD
ncbi:MULTISPECIES: SMP-30/gluconolactonase/LRE family protein [Undibacterium]|uniref:SMP-30/gluconolactonase/LRE family protein n=1 Tax=Undibacterium TaxID=401469 RepID=UPI001C9A3CE3|nr:MULTISPECIES: SMP-30/gluconolactonase/LRE family protein [Undibacterium]